MKKVIIALISVVAVVVVVFVAKLIVNEVKVVQEERIDVVAVVSQKHYKKAYTTYMPMKIGKVTTMRSVRHAARYDVTITWDAVSTTYNNQNLYNSVQENDELNAVLYRGYNQNGKKVQEKLLVFQ